MEIVALGPLAYISLQLTFGGDPNPSQWSDLSETSCDLANDMVCHEGSKPAKYC